MATWKLKNPCTFPLYVACEGAEKFTATFPSLQCSASGKTMDEAILALTKKMQKKLEAS
jgi:hypothetical protein